MDDLMIFVCEGFWNDLEVITKSLVKSAYQKIIFLFLNQNICCG